MRKIKEKLCQEGQQYDMVQQHIKLNSVFDEESWNRDYSRIKKIKELLSLRLWSIACLQRRGEDRTSGLPSHSSFVQEDGESVLLKDSLDAGGYQSVIDKLQKQGTEG